MDEVARKLLNYWRASLADGQLPDFSTHRIHPLPIEQLETGRLSPALRNKLITDARTLTGQTSQRDRDRPPPLQVIVAPLAFLPEHAHGVARRGRSVQPYIPLIIPALLTDDGQLQWQGTRLPWIARSVLEPCAEKDVPFGTIEAFDHFRATTIRPAETGWTAILTYADALIEAVSGRTRDLAELDGYKRTDAVIAAATLAPSVSHNLIRLADELAARPGELPALFRTVAGSAVGRPASKTGRHGSDGGGPYEVSKTGTLDTARRDAATRRHLGQMNGAYPLAGLQREALHHALSLADGTLVAVNGPPGTGKTTLIQSVVASLFVEAALAQGEPPVIFACSTNNQAVTNVIDSFGSVAAGDHRDDAIAGRWLPRLKSFGLYLPAQGRKIDEGKYHIAHLPGFGQQLAGFPAEMLDAVDDAESAFLDRACRALDHPFERVEEVRDALHARLIAAKREIEEALDARARILEARAAIGDDPEGVEQDAHDVFARTSALATACDAALGVIQPRGFLQGLLGLLPSVRTARWDACRRIMREAGAADAFFDGLAVPSSDRVRAHLDDMLRHTRTREKEAGDRLRAVDRWRAEERAWQATAEDVAGPRASETIEDPTLLEACLDTGLRHRMFLLATHYWEARWLLEVRELQARGREPLQALSRAREEPTIRRWRHLAKLTPCFVSTLYKLPSHLDYFAPEAGDGNKNPFLLDFLDLLIIDEAGQVAPEIGALPLSLAKRAMVVGDIHQIEPVWSVGPRIDHGNLGKAGLETHAEALEDKGALASGGSLMRLARATSAFSRDDEKGMFLAEHRRCQTPIIEICNDLVYGKRLLACAEPLKAPVLPTLGWANIRAASRKAGTSRVNEGEAEAIAEWLARRRKDIEARYGKALEAVCAVVTPFNAQKVVINAALRRHGIDPAMTVGTVHTLQGAAREIILFSPVQSLEDGTAPFFGKGPNMLNVAVSRARHGFLLFGDMRVFDHTRPGPIGVLARHLLRNGQEIVDVTACPDLVRVPDRDGVVTRLETLEDHRAILEEALRAARRRVLIVSPYISASALTADDLPNRIAHAVRRGIQVVVMFDKAINREGDQPHPLAAQGIGLLRGAGCEIWPAERVHNKTLTMDDRWIVEGSFNWLSASRKARSHYARQERSLHYSGGKAEGFIQTAWREARERRIEDPPRALAATGR